MPSANVIKEMCQNNSAKIYSAKIYYVKSINGMYCCVLFPVIHRSDAYYSTSYSRGISWLPSPEVCQVRPTSRIRKSDSGFPSLVSLSTTEELVTDITGLKKSSGPNILVTRKAFWHLYYIFTISSLNPSKYATI